MDYVDDIFNILIVPDTTRVAEQLADVADGNVSEEELARAKQNAKGRMMLSMESN